MSREITGKLALTHDNYDWENNKFCNRATIIPDTVDVSKIKEGDEVWVKAGVQGDNALFISVECEINSEYGKSRIIAHFPKQKNPKVELPDEINFEAIIVKDNKGVDTTLLFKTIESLNQLIAYLKQQEKK